MPRARDPRNRHPGVWWTRHSNEQGRLVAMRSGDLRPEILKATLPTSSAALSAASAYHVAFGRGGDVALGRAAPGGRMMHHKETLGTMLARAAWTRGAC